MLLLDSRPPTTNTPPPSFPGVDLLHCERDIYVHLPLCVYVNKLYIHIYVYTQYIQHVHVHISCVHIYSVCIYIYIERVCGERGWAQASFRSLRRWERLGRGAKRVCTGISRQGLNPALLKAGHSERMVARPRVSQSSASSALVVASPCRREPDSMVRNL